MAIFRTIPKEEREVLQRYKQQVGLQLASCGEMDCLNERVFEEIGRTSDGRIFFVLSGKGALHREKRMQSIEEGMAFLIRPDDSKTFRAIFLEPWHLVWMELSGRASSLILEQLGFEEDICAIHVEQTILHMAHQMVDSANRIGEGSLEQEMRRTSLLMDFLSWMECSRHRIQKEGQTLPNAEAPPGENGEGYRHVEYLENYFRENYSKPIRMSELADQMGITPYYMCHIFQKYRGMSPSNCLSDIRIARAMKLLEETDQPVRKVAAECGYSNPMNFSKFFSRVNGCSPSAYRKQYRLIQSGKQGEPAQKIISRSSPPLEEA